MSDPAILLKAKDYSKLVPKHGIDANGRPYTRWINPHEDRDQAPDKKGQQTMWDLDAMEADHEGKDRGYHDRVKDRYDDHVIRPLVDKFKEVMPKMAPRIQKKYAEYIFDQDTKEIDLEIDYESLKHAKLIKDAPAYADEYISQYNENTSRLKKMVNNRKKHMAAKLIDLSIGASLDLHGGRKAKLERYTSNGFPVVNIGGHSHKILWEEIRYQK